VLVYSTIILLDRAQQMTQRLLKQGYVAPWLKSSLQQIYNRHSKLIVLYLFPITYIGFFALLQAIFYRNCLSFPGTLAYRGLSGARVAHLFSFQCCELCFVMFESFAQYWLCSWTVHSLAQNWLCSWTVHSLYRLFHAVLVKRVWRYQRDNHNP
jgi:hypothetical protein